MEELKMRTKMIVSLVVGVFSLIANAQGTVVLTRGNAVRIGVEAPGLTLFVSYPGKIGDQCGLKLVRLNDLGIGVSEADNLILKTEDGQELVSSAGFNYRLPQSVISDSLFGLYITVETRDGRNLSTVLSAEEGGEWLLVSTPCAEKMK